ncbi:MAG: hypothetical protein JOZ16_12155 [Methylobacteriaceae bacterium]|nr:hypothetical protein [Methylobacteriaceae bacterium]
MNLNLNTFLLISAIVALLFGLGFVLLPGVMFSIYGIAASPASYLGFRLFGSVLVAIGLLNWLFKDSSNWEAVRALLLSVAIGNVIGLLLVLFATIAGTINAMGWSAVLIYLLLGIGDAYFVSRGPGATPERRSY